MNILRLTTDTSQPVEGEMLKRREEGKAGTEQL
jgi:hypothetical protein